MRVAKPVWSILKHFSADLDHVIPQNGAIHGDGIILVQESACVVHGLY